MRVFLGYDDYKRKHQSTDVPVFWDPASIINPHILVCGKSGTGKSTRLKQMISEAVATAGDEFERYHNLDVHGDLVIEGESRVRFDGETRYGYNPLVLDTDPRTGGVNRQINFLISTINQTSRKLMDRQEATLRNLLTDLYAFYGIHERQPATWVRKEMTEALRDEIWEQRRWGELNLYYPTLRDAIGFAERRLKAMYGGLNGSESGFRAVGALEAMNSAAARKYRAQVKQEKAFSTEEKEKAQKDFDAAVALFRDKVDEYIASIENGLEFDNLIKYDSKETLKGVIDRLKNFEARGIFNANPPPFDPDAKVWSYDLTSLSEEEKTLFCMVRAQYIARRRKLMGPVPQVREILGADEAHNLFDDDPDSIYNKICLELRKFGMALWVVSQAPSHFPEAVITTVGTKILLGIDSYYWSASCKKLNIEESVLKFIKPWKTMAVYRDSVGSTASKFMQVQLNALEEA
ncbi:helicase HerA-like domain-containing protein [Cupriavidus sp. L7L]|uniref:helicase HerA-like domain-containing protein n=1 Tax=Cupriavidus sp. L7L TaxID=2546443 RepID=UPI00105502B7|nr:helicase HerA-like domain-containing protein [Cupriavidus sp. L7L]TDF55103.1 DUF853 family protein [Cupriavidus sp. L7L]